MKGTISAAKILTWLNLIVWGGVLLSMLLASLSGNMAFLVFVFFLSAIPLHSYASLKLQQSIRFPQVKLSNQTPVGVRFIGYVAMFFGITFLFDGITALQNPKLFVDPVKDILAGAKELSQIDPVAFIRGMGIFFLLTGASVIVNVILNIRLLRWYYLVKQSDVSQDGGSSGQPGSRG